MEPIVTFIHYPVMRRVTTLEEGTKSLKRLSFDETTLRITQVLIRDSDLCLFDSSLETEEIFTHQVGQ